jgi:hypothetical protein
LKRTLLLLLVCVGGCSWFHRSAPPPPPPPELIVSGLAAGSVLFIDGAQVGQPTVGGDQTRVLEVAPGTHLLEVKVGDRVVYQESTYAGRGDKRNITVLSGTGRN